MTSLIDATKPIAGTPTTQSVRDNFAAAKSEIEAMQIRYPQIGFIDLNDTATTGSPISVPGTNTFVKLTNNAAGSFTSFTYKPPAVANNIWEVSTNQFIWTRGLKLGDMIEIRPDVVVTTTGANQTITLSIILGIGGSQYELPIAQNKLFKTAGTYRIIEWFGLYIGDNNTKNNPAELQIKSDASATVVVNGWFVKFTLIGDHP